MVGTVILSNSSRTQAASSATEATVLGVEVESLDGSGNNAANPNWGKAGTPYDRVAPARYADGKSQQVAGPNSRFISNRISNDVAQNIFSEHRVSQWGFTWGQFIDHTIGLRQAPGVGDSPDPSSRNIVFNANDPLESFRNDFGSIAFTRSTAAPGTGVNNAREQVNTVGSYIDASAVYSDSPARLEWLREGPVDGNLANNGPHLLLQNGYLPRRDARANPAAAPPMDVDGRLRANPNSARVAGDVRANENIDLTATQSLFAREHNRIVDRLPNSLSNQEKFEIARRIVIAEQQFITYNEFLPAMGVSLAPYQGYKSNVNANLTNEFATVGYRAHSQIHGEIEVETEVARYTTAQLDAIRAQGIEVTVDGADVSFVIPLGVAFFNPDLVPGLQLGPLLQGIGSESEYRNDEMIDNQLRSTLFQVPVSGNPECLDGPTLPECFRGVVDLGAIDIERGRDHGIPSYNALRAAYGLPPKNNFRDITGENTDNFPILDRLVDRRDPINDPNILDFVRLTDINGNVIPANDPRAETDVTQAVRRTTTAARLRAIYGSTNNVDAFVGMIAEPHVNNSEFGELQLAIWKKQFEALRDGDRFFYQNDGALGLINFFFGIDFHTNLGDVIARNTDIPRDELSDNVFITATPDAG